MFPSFLPKDAKSNFNSSTFTGHLWFNHVQPTFFVSLVGFETFTANIAGVSGSPGRTKLGELVPQHVLIDVRQRQHTPTKEKLGVLPTMMPYYAYVTMYWRSKYFMYITITKMKTIDIPNIPINLTDLWRIFMGCISNTSLGPCWFPMGSVPPKAYFQHHWCGWPVWSPGPPRSFRASASYGIVRSSGRSRHRGLSKHQKNWKIIWIYLNNMIFGGSGESQVRST